MRYEAITWPHKKWNIGGGVVDTGVPPSIAAQWMVNGLVKRRGVIPPEVAFDPLPYFKELSARGRGIQISEYAEGTRALNSFDPSSGGAGRPLHARWRRSIAVTGPLLSAGLQPNRGALV